MTHTKTIAILDLLAVQYLWMKEGPNKYNNLLIATNDNAIQSTLPKNMPSMPDTVHQPSPNGHSFPNRT